MIGIASSVCSECDREFQIQIPDWCSQSFIMNSGSNHYCLLGLQCFCICQDPAWHFSNQYPQILRKALTKKHSFYYFDFPNIICHVSPLHAVSGICLFNVKGLCKRRHSQGHNSARCLLGIFGLLSLHDSRWNQVL